MTETSERIEIVDSSPSLDDWMFVNKNQNNENEEVEVIDKKEEEDGNEQVDENVNASSQNSDARVHDLEWLQIVGQQLMKIEETNNKHDEDSDISVVEEDCEHTTTVARRVSETIDKSELVPFVDRFSKLSQSGFTKNVVIVCLLAIIVAMYTDRSSKVDNACIFGNGMDYQLENKMLKDQLKEFNTVLSQMKPYISELHSAQNRPKGNVENPSAIYGNFTDPNHFNKTSPIPEILLQSSLNSLCSVFGSQNTNNPVINTICESRDVIFNLIEFKSVVNNFVQEFERLNNPTVSKYLQDMDQKLNRLCQSLLEDFSVALDRKIQKLKKLNGKLNKWICEVKDNKKLYDALVTKFDKNNMTLKGCDEIVNSTYEYKKRRNYVEDNYPSNATFNFWRKDGFNKYKERKFDKKKEERKCYKRKHANGENEDCQDFVVSQEHISPDFDRIKVPDSPWSAIKSTFKNGKAKKPHKLKGKSANKKQKQFGVQETESSELNESQDEDVRKNYEWKEAKYKKYNKKGKKCSSRKCKKSIKYTNKTRSINPTSHFDKHYIKKKKSRNAQFKSTINTAPHFSKTIILTTERMSATDEDDSIGMDPNSEWQWERNKAREMYRRLQNDQSDWYFERANSRKHARKDAFTKKVF